jgi:HAD superfamily hydrolase (TIGR01509 family)
MRPFRAVILDMDGTLFGTERIAVDAVVAAFQEHGVSVAPRALETIIGRSGKETRAFLSQFVPGGVGADEILERGRVLIETRIEREGLPVKPGVTELLPLLYDRGIALGLATSTRTAVALANLRRAKLDGYFRTVVGGDQVENAKPHPDVYLKALSALGIPAAETLAVEDSDLGIQAAAAAGLRVIHVPDIKQVDAATKALVHREYATLCAFSDELVAGTDE